MSSQKLFNAQVRRRIALERYSNAQGKELLGFLDDLQKDIASQMVRVTPGKRAEFRKMLREVRGLHEEAYEKFVERVGIEQRALAREEAAFQATKFDSAGITSGFNRITADAAYTAATTRPMDGALMRDWFKGMEPRARDRLNRALQISFIEGESLSSSMRRMKDVVGGVNRRAAVSVIRTANTHISNSVQQASAEANSDIVKEVEWRSILDGQTTPICQSRDGNRYPIDSGPRPPAHIGCRSIVTEVLNGFPPPDRQTYGEWLNAQENEVQDEILGPSRARLLRSGKITVKGFVDKRGKKLTLEELGQVAPKPKPKVPKTLRDRRYMSNSQARKEVLKRGRSANNRYIAAVDNKTGELLDIKSGGRSVVRITEDLETLMNGEKRRVVLHYNTANNQGMAGGMASFVEKPGVRSVWAHTNNGASFKVSPRLKPFEPSGAATMSAYIEGAIKSQVRLGNMTLEDARLISDHVAMLAIKRQGGIRYTYTLSKAHKAAMRRNWKIVRHVLARAS